MSEFNELVKSFLLGNNIPFEESEKEPNTYILSEMGKKQGILAKLFEGFKPQKESLKLFILDRSSNDIEINEEVDFIIWNDSLSGKNLEESIKRHISKKENIQIDGPLQQYDPRYIGMGKDILFVKFSNKSREEDFLEMNKEIVNNTCGEDFFLKEIILEEKRFVFILEETNETQYLKREYNHFMTLFCQEKGLTGQSLPIYFDSNDFWFGGLLHAQLTNRLDQALGLFFTEDSIFYMVRLGYIIPFINEIDLFCKEGYLNPQSPYISHIFHLCGERGMFVTSCSRYNLFFEDIREIAEFENLKKNRNNKWLKTIAKPMGARILEDEINSIYFENETQLEVNRVMQQNELLLKKWFEDRDFPILKTIDKKILIKQVAVQWMEKGYYYIELDEFNNLLFESNILSEGKRALAHIHEIVRAVVNSNILILSDYNQIIPISKLMGYTIILWILEEEFHIQSLKDWLFRPAFSQRFYQILLKRFALDENRNILMPLLLGVQDILNEKNETVTNLSRNIIENALDMYIAFQNSPYIKNSIPITGKRLYDLTMSHKLIYKLKFQGADLHNTLFQQSVFIECEFKDCNLTSAYFAGSTFLNCQIINSNLRNADFSGSYFRNCIIKNNKYDDLIIIGCSFSKCKIDIEKEKRKKNRALKIWSEASSGIGGQKLKQNFDLPILIYLLWKKNKFYTRYGFNIDPDIHFKYFKNELSNLKSKNFLEQYNYCDIYDETDLKPELFFAMPGTFYYVNAKCKKEFNYKDSKNLFIDHVIKYKTVNENGIENIMFKILFHTEKDIFIEENQNMEYWFRNPICLSNKLIGHGVSGIFSSYEKLLIATDIGGLFLFRKKNNEWFNTDNQFQSEPVSKIYPDCFENMIFVKRGSSVIEIWDTLNELLMSGRIVTSFKEILSIRLIENLYNIVIYGEWVDGSVGALVYNIINKHLITYWNILSKEKILNEKSEELEIKYFQEVEILIASLKEKALREVSLKNGYLKKGCKELSQIMESLEIVPPHSLVYMEGESVEFEWKIKSNDPERFPINKTFTDIISGNKLDFEYEIKIGDILNVQSGVMKIEHGTLEISIKWKESFLDSKNIPCGDYNLNFNISLLGEERQQEGIFKLRPKNPFKGGESISKKIGSDYLFVGRKTELKIALELISNGSSFSIKGARRIGKTSFMNRLLEILPENFIAAYVSFEEFETNSSHSLLLSKIQKGLNNLKKTYPEIYYEFREEFDASGVLKPSLDFEWLVSLGLDRLKEKYPELIMQKIIELEKERRNGASLTILIDKLADYLKSMNSKNKIVFIIDEIGIVEKKGIKLNEIFTPFRPIIGRGNIVIILAGIPLNFHELTKGADLIKDSGFMSYLNKQIILGPLSKEECKGLIRNNLSSRFNIDDNVLEYALQLSAMRPEDLQIIMHQALEKIIFDNSSKKIEQNQEIEYHHIEAGFSELLEKRGWTCAQIWEKISLKGKDYLKNKLNANGKSLRELLDVALDEVDFKNICEEDIEIFKGYGFTNPDEKSLIIPVYFQEWIRQQYYLRQFKMED